MELLVHTDGTIRCLYGEEIDLKSIGPLTIRRVSHLEPDASGNWNADLQPVGGPELGPFSHRSRALQAERAWLRQHWLGNC